MRYLLDCDVLSEQTRPRPDAGLMNWLLQNEGAAAVSETTIAELYKGAFMMSHGGRREKTFAWIGDLEAVFGDRLLPVDLLFSNAGHSFLEKVKVRGAGWL